MVSLGAVSFVDCVVELVAAFYFRRLPFACRFSASPGSFWPPVRPRADALKRFWNLELNQHKQSTTKPEKRI